jgi:hypothetical protein
MASAASKSLRPVDRNVWLQIVWRYNGMNNGRLAVPARAVADEIGVHHSTVARALQALMTYVRRAISSDRLAEKLVPQMLPCGTKKQIASV